MTKIGPLEIKLGVAAQIHTPLSLWADRGVLLSRFAKTPELQTALPRSHTVMAAEVSCEVTGIMEADLRHDIPDGQRGVFEKESSPLHAHRLEMSDWPDARFSSKEVREPGGGQIRGPGERRHRNRLRQPLFHILEGSANACIH
jgi:hypothetical protein